MFIVNDLSVHIFFYLMKIQPSRFIIALSLIALLVSFEKKKKESCSPAFDKKISCLGSNLIICLFYRWGPWFLVLISVFEDWVCDFKAWKHLHVDIINFWDGCGHLMHERTDRMFEPLTLCSRTTAVCFVHSGRCYI